jgi:hypothetical protein
MRPFIVFAFAVASGAAALVIACTDQTNDSFASSSPAVDSGSTPDSTTSATDTGAADAPAAVDAGAGSGSIAGAVGGTPFTTVMSAYWIGVPDSAATTAVYLIGTQLACADLAASGWAHTITAGTPIFEMIMTSKTPVTDHYTVSTASSPPVGSAEVNYIVAAPARNETRSTTGSIDLTSVAAGIEAVGMFDVQFGASDGGDAGANSLSGTFRAAYCAGGHEP